MEWRRWDLEEASPSFKSEPYPKLQIFVEMRFRTNICSRLDYQPLFGKWARAPPTNGEGRPDTKERRKSSLNMQRPCLEATQPENSVTSWNSTAQTRVSSFTCTTFSLQMVKNPEESISVFRPLCQATPQAWSSKCASFQMKDAIQFKSCQHIYIVYLLCLMTKTSYLMSQLRYQLLY